MPRRTGCALLVAAATLSAQSVVNLNPETPNTPHHAAKPGSEIRITLPGDHRKARLSIGTENLRIAARTHQAGSTILTLRLPNAVAEGCYVPVHIIENGAPLPDSIPIAISSTGACRPPMYQFSNAWITKHTGIVARIQTTEWALETAGQQHTVDIAGAFFDGDATLLRPGTLLRFPPPGYCASRSGAYPPGTARIDILLPLLIDDLSGKELDAGSTLAVDDGRYQMTIPQVIGRSAMFHRTVASSQQQLSALQTSGNLRVRATGGREVGPFAATLPLPEPFDWTNRPTTPLLPLRRDIPLAWETAGSPGVVLLAAMALDAETSRYSYCLCIADAAARRFALPAPILRSLLQAVSPNLRETAGMLYLIHAPQTLHSFPSDHLETAVGLSLQVHAAKLLLQR